MTDPRLERWLAALVALSLLGDGPVVDVGSGGGSPGLPLAVARPDLRFDLLEANAKKCAFLREVAAEIPNVEVVQARAEDHALGEGRDAYGTALARALALPPVAVEWCLPLVAPGGRLVLFAGEIDEAATARAAGELAARLSETVAVEGSQRQSLLVFEKEGPTPPRFPRKAGTARKRPLA